MILCVFRHKWQALTRRRVIMPTASVLMPLLLLGFLSIDSSTKSVPIVLLTKHSSIFFKNKMYCAYRKQNSPRHSWRGGYLGVKTYEKDLQIILSKGLIRISHQLSLLLLHFVRTTLTTDLSKSRTKKDVTLLSAKGWFILFSFFLDESPQKLIKRCFSEQVLAR